MADGPRSVDEEACRESSRLAVGPRRIEEEARRESSKLTDGTRRVVVVCHARFRFVGRRQMAADAHGAPIRRQPRRIRRILILSVLLACVSCFGLLSAAHAWRVLRRHARDPCAPGPRRLAGPLHARDGPRRGGAAASQARSLSSASSWPGSPAASPSARPSRSSSTTSTTASLSVSGGLRRLRPSDGRGARGPRILGAQRRASSSSLR